MIFRNRHYFILLFLVLTLAGILRLCKITLNPPSLFGDELDVGYHAYSILKTGKDYQGNFLPLNFHSLAEWRTPLYLYSAVPTVALFGISPLGVRLPAAIFGILCIYALHLLIREMIYANSSYIKYDSFFDGIRRPEILAPLLLAINPWHMQYSRAGFEVTMMLAFLLFGFYFFFKAINNKGTFLPVSLFLIILTPLIYSTAKLFTPMIIVVLLGIYYKQILKLNKRALISGLAVGAITGGIVAYSILFFGGSQRFSYISIFSDPTIEPEIGTSRLIDSMYREETGVGLSPKFIDRALHNKFVYEGGKVLKNYLQSFSTEFLFIKGDPDPRHSVGIGEFYRIEIFALIVGLIFFFTSTLDSKTKIFVGLWILISPIPSALTRDGGNHATRLILLLPPVIFIIAYGWSGLVSNIKNSFRLPFLVVVGFLYTVSLFGYLHQYRTHYPFESQRWWHYGWTPAISEVKKLEKDYDKVVISMSGEPAWIFFAANYQYPPKLWQNEYPIGNDTELNGFGKLSHTGKFYFGTPIDSVKIYGLGKVIDSKTLYLANASEVGANLIMEPARVPEGLKLIKAVAFPTGEPAMYLFSGKAN